MDVKEFSDPVSFSILLVFNIILIYYLFVIITIYEHTYNILSIIVITTTKVVKKYLF